MMERPMLINTSVPPPGVVMGMGGPVGLGGMQMPVPGSGGVPSLAGGNLNAPAPATQQGNNNIVMPPNGNGISQKEGQNILPLIDYRIKQNHFLGARFIFECGAKLEAESITIATAAILYHRFFKEIEDKNYDIYLMGATSLYLAGKVEGQNLKLRDVINVAYATLHRNSLPLDLSDKYWSFRDAIVQAELLMMRVLSFQTNIVHPHKFLVHYLKTLEEWIGFNPTARFSWAFLQDFHHDSSIISYPPQAVALAAIQLIMSAFGAQVPLCSQDGRNSFANIVYPEVNPEIQKEIMLKMLLIHEKEAEIYPTIMYREVANGK